VKLAPTAFGGGQESGLRPGTENVAGIVGAGVAFSWAQASWRERAEQVQVVRDEVISYLHTELPEVILNGSHGEERVANNINISLPGIDTEFATVVLDTHGFAVSTKSACSGAGGGESAVVREISGDPARATSTLRITLGTNTLIDQLKDLVTVLKAHIQKVKQY
jgi:cysteine desulfurase